MAHAFDRPTRHHLRRSAPSRWSKRIVVALVALLGAAISVRLALYHLGWSGAPWEPLFGDGSRRVLTSAFSRALPFPDAGLGAIAYVLEAALVLWAKSERWRSAPLRVYAYAAVAAAMAVGSACLVVLQIAVVRALCTLCLASAAISFALAAPAWTEARAAWNARKR